jgi:multidrug efflux system outer membrane protein
MARRSPFVAFVLLPLLSGCSLVPDFERPAAPTPQAFQAVDSDAQVWPSQDWWLAYRSPELDRLIDTAKRNNFDLGVAAARILQAEAQTKISGASLLPSVDFGGGASRSYAKEYDGGRSVNITDSVSADLRASYQLDLFGANRADLLSAKSNLLSSRFDQETVSLSVVSDVANAYFQVLSFRDRLDVARRNLDLAERVLGVVDSRVRNGAASQLDLAQQTTAIANQRASLAALDSQLEQAGNNLALLLGAAPGDMVGPSTSLLEIVPPTVAPGQPSELLVRRPDIQAAEARLRSANAQIGVARAAYFPSIDLVGRYSRDGANLASLFNPAALSYSVAASLVQPIFAGGAIDGGVELAEARKEELVQTYRKAIVSAFNDVQNSLVVVDRSEVQEQYQMDAADSARRAFELAESRYREGATDLLTLLDAQRSLNAAEDNLVQIRFARLQASVSLFRALGGGWRLGGETAASAP